ncbi:MAG: hypothetical protein ACR2K1_13480 [Saprospiraceae bacterium]
MKNYISQTLWLTILVALLATALGFLPEGVRIGAFTLRPMDIFGDIRKDLPLPPPPDTIPEADTLAMIPPPVADSLLSDSIPPLVDSLLFGQILEDYSRDGQGLAAFFAATDSIRAHKRRVRVAFFGDSFVEGDIVLGDLRDTLQTLWGGQGVGFVPITSEVARFKRTLQHEYAGWNTYSIVRKTPGHPAFGINGFAYTPGENAKIQYQGASAFRHTKSWSQFRLFYGGDSLSSFWYTINNGDTLFTQPTPVEQGMPGVLEIKRSGMRAIELQFPNPGGWVLYGASLEDGPGFYLDNFSVRGNSGGKLKLIEPAMMQAFDQLQGYDLVIVQLGLNAITTGLDNVDWYRWELDGTFAHLKRCFPDRPILIVGVPDRAGKIADTLSTLPAVPVIVDMQRSLARKYGFIFYDLYRGMGGPGTMIRFATEKPALASKDFTHLTHEGGRTISRLFTRVLLEEKARTLARDRIAN